MQSNRFPKILDRFLADTLFRYIHPLLSSQQHGFIKGRSTVSNLLEITQFLHNNLHCGKQVDVIYFDYSKAFDTIDHFILANKLARLSLPFQLFSLIMTFTMNRQYTLKINRTPTTLSFSPSSGVPQGSHLGPLLFIIYRNDIPSLLPNVNCLLYADDTKI